MRLESSDAMGRLIRMARAMIAKTRQKRVSHLRIFDILEEFSFAFKRNRIAAHDSRRCRIRFIRWISIGVAAKAIPNSAMGCKKLIKI